MQIKDLDLCTSVWIEESGVAKEYFIVQKDEYGVMVLRTNCCSTTHRYDTNGYYNSEVDNWLENETTGLKSVFSSQVQSALINRSIPYYNYGDTELRYMSRAIFLPSYTELFGKSGYNELKDGNYFGGIVSTKYGNLKSVKDGSSDYGIYITRSISGYNSQWRVYEGQASSYNMGYHEIRPCLNIDPTAEITYANEKYNLLPQQRTYGEVDFKIKVGTSTDRPKSARVIVEQEDLYDVQLWVTNNYDDATPVWYSVTSGGQVSIANSTKSTDTWRIGVRCYGKSNNRGTGCFHEPVVMIETE